ncbi:hypothetical protein CN964_21280 [Bacillus cereus]|uniref:hypothetical protein n=1 Tax=Bacillus cereus TaxID=1396 RepID=UPI000BF3D551|nr:hypothetical protein [Bacillus cereus]PFJ30944.1 hypothetical protein COI90_20735 [Bacillus cereus]PFO23932.1 hypothetical protein COJ80_16640 [Bacillus cereus]PGN71175.1 hypothetical protein CN964_21280 [Bacillus cereus]
MAKVFDARRAIFIPATGGHPPLTEYRVAWGYENWGKPVAVTKVQMVYNNKVAGMLSPSYPDKTLDEQAMILALDLVKKGYGTSSKKSRTVLILKQFDPEMERNELIDVIEDELIQMYQDMYTKPGATITVPVHAALDKELELEGNVLAFIFNVDIA